MLPAMPPTMMTVRSKPLPPKKPFRPGLWLGIAAALLIAASGTIAIAFFPGLFSFVNANVEIVENGSFRVIKVPPGGSIQAAVNAAKGGDIVELQAGATYKGPVKLPDKPGTDFITIRTSASDAELPPANTRLDPKKYAAALPKIISDQKGEAAVVTTAGAHHYRFIGIDFGPTVEGFYNIIQIGSGEETSVDQLPHHIEFDHVYVHGSPTYGQRRGIAANGRFIKISNSYFSDFKREGEESQAIAVWAADGPIEIVNNYLEAAAESILFGGAASKLGIVPGNAIIRDNWMNKPVEWRNTKWVVKNFLEIKSGRNIKIENNLMTNNWTSAQEGTGILFRTGADSGPSTVVEDIEFTSNILRGSGSAITIQGNEGNGGRRLTIRNNVFEDIASKKWEGRGYFLKPTTWDGLVIENNTVIHDGAITIAWGDPIRQMVFRNNIVFQNEYGFFGDGSGPGKPAIAKYFPGSIITNNVIVGGDIREYGGGNTYPKSIGEIGFTETGKSDYRLRSDSPYLRKGFGGNQIGANLDPKTVGGR